MAFPTKVNDKHFYLHYLISFQYPLFYDFKAKNAGNLTLKEQFNIFGTPLFFEGIIEKSATTLSCVLLAVL